MRFLARIELRRAQIEISVLERLFGVGKSSLYEQFCRTPIPLPQRQRLFQAINSASIEVVALAVGGSGEILGRMVGENNALAMRLVFADGVLQRLDCGVAIPGIRRHSLQRHLVKLAR